MILLNKPLEPDLKKLTGWLTKVHENHWYSNFGPLSDELTHRLEDYLGVRHLLLVNNGTSALQVAGRALNANSILSTPFSYVATSSAFLWQKDKLAYSDIDDASYNLCPKGVEKYLQNNHKFNANIDTNIDAIVATHVYGNPCDVEALSELAARFDTKLIFDAAHAFGVKLGDSSILNYGDASTLSFHATKLFHTAEGGAIIFKEKDDFELAKSMTTCGYKKGELVNLGINTKLNEYQAAIGLTNLDVMDNVIEHRCELFLYYRLLLQDTFNMPSWHSDASHNGAYMPITCGSEAQLAAIKHSLTANGIGCREYFSPSLDLMFAPSKPMLVSQKMAKLVLCLPLHFYMTKADVTRVCDVVNGCLV